MQHFKYSSLKNLHFFPEMSYLKTFVKSNIKMLFTYPKSIYYSQRYNAGEKFLLRDPNLYPYYYNIDLNQQENVSPLNSSISLLTATNETFILKYPNLKANSFSVSKINNVDTEFKNNFNTLNSLITNRLEDSENLDLPVVVYARILYAGVLANARGNSNMALDQENFNLCLSKFIEKLEYADSESIAYVMFSLSHFGNFEANVWNLLGNALKEKFFIPEYSLVSPKEPHVFRYEDVDEKSGDSDLLDNFGNKIFVRGYMPVFLAYSALVKANGNGVDCGDYLRNMSGRFPNINEDVQSFDSAMFE